MPTVVVVGLGPGGAEFVTQHTLDLIGRIPHRFLRTGRHPSAHLVAEATTFDDVYEMADTFDDVYAEIAERLVARCGRARRGAVRRARVAARARTDRPHSSWRCAHRLPRRAGDVVPRPRVRSAGHRPGGIRRDVDRRARVRHGGGRSPRPLARRPHARQLGAERHQARRGVGDRRGAGGDPARPRDRRRGGGRDHLGRPRSHARRRPPHVHLHPASRRPGGGGTRPLSRVGPHPARAVPVGP